MGGDKGGGEGCWEEARVVRRKKKRGREGGEWDELEWVGMSGNLF